VIKAVAWTTLALFVGMAAQGFMWSTDDFIFKVIAAIVTLLALFGAVLYIFIMTMIASQTALRRAVEHCHDSHVEVSTAKKV
jgi:hypothetical protein